MRKVQWFLALSMLALLLFGCGGGSHNNAATTRKGRATFVVRWPVRKPTRLIPVASNSILVTLSRNGTQVASQLLPRPATGNQTQAVFDPLPVDNLLVVATAFPNTDGTGVAQATGSTMLAVQADTNTTVTLTMDSTIDHLDVMPNPVMLVYGTPPGNTQTITATARDKDNNIVLTAGTFNWTTDNARVATVTPAGSTATVVGVGVGSTTVHVTETESNKSSQTLIKVRGSGLLARGWAKFHADAQNSGRINQPFASAATNWTTSLNGPIDASPVIDSSGTAYVGSGDGNIYAINPDGSIKWSFNIGGHIKGAPALASDGTIYAASSNGRIVALEKMDGSTKWDTSFFDSFLSSPTIGPDGNVYLGSANGTVFSINGSTGEFVWGSGVGGVIESSPALSPDGKRLYIGSGDRMVHALNTADGGSLWTFPTGGAVQSSPSVNAADMVFFGSDDGNIYAVRGADGGAVWQNSFNAGSAVTTSPAIATLNGVQTLLIGSNSGMLFALRADTGAQIAAPFQAGASIRSSAAVSGDGTILFGADDLKFYGLQLNVTGFSQRFTPVQTGGAIASSPAIGIDLRANSGVVIFGSTDGNLYSLTSGG